MTIKLLQKLGRRKKVKLECCQNNLDRFLDEDLFREFAAFFQEEQILLKEYKCLSQCELCAEKPYLKLNGEIIEADSARELLNLLKMRRT